MQDDEDRDLPQLRREHDDPAYAYKKAFPGSWAVIIILLLVTCVLAVFLII
jgi:hypothetical protein